MKLYAPKQLKFILCISLVYLTAVSCLQLVFVFFAAAMWNKWWTDEYRHYKPKYFAVHHAADQAQKTNLAFKTHKIFLKFLVNDDWATRGQNLLWLRHVKVTQIHTIYEWVLNKAGVKRELLDTVKARKWAYYSHTMRKQRKCLQQSRLLTSSIRLSIYNTNTQENFQTYKHNFL